MHPLVKTENEASFYEDVDGCGVHCQNPFFTEEEHGSLHTFTAFMGSLCLLLTLTAAVSLQAQVTGILMV